MKRAIVDFSRDEQLDWAAVLVCGHRQHTRHNPPVSERPWVLTAEGRAERLGTDLDCPLCDRLEIPSGFESYQRTPDFDQGSIPKSLQKAHTTKRGVWALIHVSSGQLEYSLYDPFNRQQVVTAASPGVIPPEVKHHVRPLESVVFCVEFWRAESLSRVRTSPRP